MPRDFHPPSGDFQTTHWSLKLVAARSGSPTSAEALAQLCADYWPPLYGYVRRCGHAQHAAQDLTQEFLARLVDKQFLKAADQYVAGAAVRVAVERTGKAQYNHQS